MLVAALTHGSRTAETQQWLAAQRPGDLVISDWTTTEFSAALSMKVRMRALQPAAPADVLTTFRRMAQDSLVMLPVDQEDFGAAASLVDRYGSGLRAGDALHLGITVNHRCVLVSLDRQQVDAAVSAGISARLF